MNACVATGTRLTPRRLDVLRHGRYGRCGVRRREVAVQADRVHTCLEQKLWIRPPMREVAGSATFSFDRGVFIDKGSRGRNMAFGANNELPRRRRRRIFSRGAVRIMAVCAVDQPLFNLVVNGSGELRLHLAVTLEAKLWLLHFEQLPGRMRGVDTVAVDAAHISLAMGRVLKVCVSGLMACLAHFIHVLGDSACGVEDQGSGAVLHVRLAGPMTALTRYVLPGMDKSLPAVRIVGKVLHDVFVAGRAGGCANRIA